MNLEKKASIKEIEIKVICFALISKLYLKKCPFVPQYILKF